MTKLLVVGGEQTQLEVINIDEKHLDLVCNQIPNFPWSTHATTGGLYLGKLPIICGGDDDEGVYCDCFALSEGSWSAIPSLNECRYGAASVVLKWVLVGCSTGVISTIHNLT